MSCRAVVFLALCGICSSVAAQSSPETAIRDHYLRELAGHGTRCVVLHGVRILQSVTEGDSVSVDVEAVATTWTTMPGSRPATESHFATMTLRRDGDDWRVTSMRKSEELLADRLAGATSDTERISILDEAPDQQTPALVAALCRRAVKKINERAPDAAQTLIDVAERVAAECRTADTRSAILGVQSVLARRRGEPLRRGIELVTQSLAAAEESGDADAIARALLRLGRAQTEMSGTGTPPLEPYMRILALSDWIEDRATVSLAASALSQRFNNLVDTRNGLRYALLAEKEAEASGDRMSLLSALMNTSGVYAGQGDAELQRRYLERSLDLARELDFPATAASILAALGSLYSGSDDPEQRARADALYAQGLAMIGCNEPGVGTDLLVSRALLAMDSGRLQNAEADLYEAIRRGLASSEAILNRVLFAFARLRLLQQRPEESLAFTNQVRQFMATRAPDSRLHLATAKALRALHRTDEAKRELEEGCRTLEASRSDISSDPRQQQSFLVDRLDIFRELIDLLLERGEKREALAVADRMKARSLLDMRSSGGKSFEDAWTESERRERLTLEQAIVQLNRAARLKANDEALQRARIALEEFQARAAALHGSPEPAAGLRDPANLPASLEGVTVVDFVIGEEKTTVFALERRPDGSTDLQTARIAVSQRALRKEVDDFARRIAQRDLDYGAAAHRLYDLLLRPVEAGLLRNRMLCIIPDSILWKLPFAALLRPNGEHLAARTAIFYAPSLAVLTAPAPHRDPANESQVVDLIAFANPSLDGTRRRSIGEVYRSVPLDPLPEAEEEVRELARLYGPLRSRVYTGSLAREATLKEEVAHARILHVATHGVLNDTAPMFSALVLVAAPEDATEDGLLEAREVVRLPVRADLTILSACDTASGRLTPGEGIVGMTWAFLAAGSATSVSSQWRAESASTSRLMVELHQRLLRGASPASALRGAQLALQRDRRWSHPFYWAPFVVIGAGNN